MADKGIPAAAITVDRNITPIPDPTLLTSAALAREISNVREIISREISSLKELLEARLTGMETAHTLLAANVAEGHTNADSQRANLKELVYETFKTTDEKFGGIDKRFTQYDAQTEKAARDVKSAVDAAFAAAKEAVGEQNKSNALSVAKSETGFTKQIDQLQETIKTMVKSIDDKIDDVKSRLTLIEGRSAGMGLSWGVALGIFGVVGVLVGIAGVVIAVLPKH